MFTPEIKFCLFDLASRRDKRIKTTFHQSSVIFGMLPQQSSKLFRNVRLENRKTSEATGVLWQLSKNLRHRSYTLQRVFLSFQQSRKIVGNFGPALVMISASFFTVCVSSEE